MIGEQNGEMWRSLVIGTPAETGLLDYSSPMSFMITLSLRSLLRNPLNLNCNLLIIST